MGAPRWRFRVRTLMVAVLVFAVIAWVGVLVWRSDRYLDRAGRFRKESLNYAALEQMRQQDIARIAALEREAGALERGDASEQSVASGIRRVVALERSKLEMEDRLVRSSYGALRLHYESLAAKYERAARYPWFSVEPDPPCPRAHEELRARPPPARKASAASS
jgi:hypothetical protein